MADLSLSTGQSGGIGNSKMYLSGSSAWNPAVDASFGDNILSTGILAAAAYGYNSSGWDRLRTPQVFKVTAGSAATTADTTVWTPTPGKKFRLLGFTISGTTGGGAAGSSSYNTWSFWDSTGSSTGGASSKIFVQPGAFNVPAPSPPLGNGILSASTQNMLSVVRLSTNISLDCTVWGTEE